MMASIFTLLFLTLLFIWRGKRRTAFSLFVLSFGLSIFWFFHHATTSIGLAL